MTTLTQELATDGQRKLLARIAADAGEKSVLEFTGLTKDGAELAKGNPEFAARIREATTAALRDLAVTDKYKDEEVRPRWGYPKSYKPGTVEAQIELLRSHFPFLNPDPAIKYYREVYGSLAHPEWVEGPFVIIPTTTFKKHCFPQADGAELLCSAVNLGLEKLGGSRRFYNYREGEITPDRFQRKARYQGVYEQLYASQPDSDLIIVGGQYGKFHGGQSMRRALERMQGQVGELPAGALEGVVMALANPTRYSKWEELDTDLPADEFRPGVGAAFSFSPCLLFHVGKLGFDVCDADRPFERYGAVSFSVPPASPKLQRGEQ